MAEAFGIGSGIVGVISLTIQVAQIVVQFGLDWKDAPKAVKDFMAELQTLKTALSETNTNLILNPEFRKAFADQPSALLSQSQGYSTGSDKSQAEIATSECHNELNKLLVELEKRGKGHRIGWERFKTPFLLSSIRESVKNLHRLCQSLNSLVSIDASLLGARTYNLVETISNEHKAWHDADDNEKVLKWLSNLSFSNKQSENLSKRHPGTGIWLLEHDKFRKWRDESADTGGILWCPGIPGAGKTIMTSIVIDHLQQEPTLEDAVIAYLYCDYKDRKNQTTGNLLACLAKQLLLARSEMPLDALDLYRRHKNSHSSPPLTELSELLQSLLKHFQRCFILVDALDEHLGDDKDSTSVQLPFLEELQRLQTIRNFSLFITSRENRFIGEQLKGAAQIKIGASKPDVRAYLDSRLLDQSKFRFANDLRTDLNLKDLVLNKLVENSQDMFLLPYLHLDYLGGQTRLRKLRDALNHLPTKLHDRYNDCMERIQGQVQEHRRLALLVLSWISCAVRPLKLKELQHALSTELGDSQLEQGPPESEAFIVSVCAGLITVDALTRVVRLVHFTLQEWFEATKQRWFPDADKIIAETCLTYLSFEKFAKPISSYRVYEEREKLRKTHSLLEYAAQNWGIHARRDGEIRVKELAVQFLNQDSKTTNAANFIYVFRKDYDDTSNWVSGIHLCSYFGLYETLIGLASSGLLASSRTASTYKNLYRTPLSYAAAGGHDDVVRYLLSRNADHRDHRDHYGGKTALHYAAENGHISTVEVLLNSGAGIDPRQKYGDTPLHMAVRRGLVDMPIFLLEKGANPNIPSAYSTVLETASTKGDLNLLQNLLHKGAQVDAVCNRGQTPLMAAAYHCQETIAEELIKAGSNVRKVVEGSTALSKAASGGNMKILKMLLDNGADIRDPNEKELAAERGHVEVIDHLLSLGADPNADGWFCPLIAASLEGHENAVKLLLERGAEPNPDPSRWRRREPHALQISSARGFPEVVKFLLKAGADPNTICGEHSTALLAATWEGSEECAKALMDAGADINSCYQMTMDTDEFLALFDSDVDLWSDNIYSTLEAGSRGYVTGYQLCSSAVQLAAFLGFTDILQEMLRRGGDVQNSCGGHFGTVLQAAAASGAVEIVNIVLEAGADVSQSGGIFGSAIGAAIEAEQEDVVQRLLDAAPSNEKKEELLADALESAIYSGNADMIQFLIKKGVRMPVPGNYDCCAEYFFREIVGWMDDEDMDALLETLKMSGSPPELYGTGLITAIKTNKPDLFQKLLCPGTDLNTPAGKYGTALIASSVLGREEMAKKLLELGAEVNVENSRYGTPLIAASWIGHEKIVQLLLNHNANAAMQTQRHGSALLVAASRGHLSVVQMLMALSVGDGAWNKIQGEALIAAAAMGHATIVRFLVKQVEDVNCHLRNYATVLGHTSPVEFHLQRVEYLLNAAMTGETLAVHDAMNSSHSTSECNPWSEGAKCWQVTENIHCENPTLAKKCLDSALFYAVCEGDEILTNILIRQGADVNAVDKVGSATPLIYASEMGHDAVIKLLIDAGARINKIGGTCKTALLAAIWAGHDNAAQFLIRNDANPTLTSDLGEDWFEIYAGELPEELYYEIEAGEMGFRTTTLHTKPLQAAAFMGLRGTVEMIIGEVRSINVPVGQLGTPLQAAIAGNRLDIVRLLLDSGADPNTFGGLTEKPLAEGISDEIKDLLRNRGARSDTEENGLAIRNRQGEAMDLTEG